MQRIEANDVLNEIEFELLQGSISRDDLGKGIQTVRHFHNEMRTEVLDERKDGDLLAIARRQFQVNDMLLTLLAETGAKVRALQGELRRSAFMIQHAGPDAHRSLNATAAAVDLVDLPRSTSLTVESDADGIAWSGGIVPRGGARLDELENAMDPDSLQLEMDVRPSHIPLLGSFLTRLRVALHSLTLFYAGRLASRQGDANRVFGEWILQDAETQRRQQMEIDSLQAQIAELKRQLPAGE